MDQRALSERFTSGLGLSTPPVALARVAEPPAGVAREGLAPSACTFWRKAETGVFFADTGAHYGCSVGAMVMGFDLVPDVATDLQATIGTMGSLGYLEEAEPPKIPALKPGHQGMLYGPLAEFPIEPDLVVMWLTPSQAMFYAEAAGSARWSTDGPGRILGRPACSALAAAQIAGDSTLSLGCIGMRTFTEVSDDRLLAAVSGSHIEALAGDLAETLNVNATMRDVYGQRGAATNA